MEQLLSWHSRLAAVYRCPEVEMASSHNDMFKPDNILFDGERVWLVDWEAAFFNDRYVDLAAAANLVVTTEAEELEFLETYLGRAPQEYEQARLFLMRQLTRMFYTMAFLVKGRDGQPVELTGSVPDHEAFHRKMWAGKVNLADSADRIAYGRVQWERLVANMGSFEHALEVVSRSPGSRQGL